MERSAHSMEQETPTTENELVTIRYKGKSYTVTTDVADAWNERGEEASQTIRNDRAELARWRRGELRQDQMAQQQPPRKSKAERDVEILANPATEFDNLRDEMRQEQENLKQQLIQQQIEKWWDGFYNDNPHLREKDEFLRSIAMNEANAGRWQGLTDDDCKNALTGLATKAGWSRPQSDDQEEPHQDPNRRVLRDTPVQSERPRSSTYQPRTSQGNQPPRSEVQSVMEDVRQARLASRKG